MLKLEWLLFWLIGIIAVAIWAGCSLWSREAKLERRRRKSHSRVISKSNHPSVRFSVRVPGKEKKK